MDEQPGANNARSEMPTPTIRLESVSKKFLSKSGEEVKALEGITFDVARSEFVSIIGPSGCGKSTVLSLIAGLDKPSEGKVYLDGEEVRGTNPDKISIMFQEHTLFPWRTIQANVEFGLELKGASKDARSEASRKYLDLVGLGGFENKFPREVSGGMKQRASLARSLALDPEVVLMDEPFGALDEQTRMQLGNELVRIWLETKKTIVFVTHSIQEAAYLSDRVLVFSKRPARIVREIKIDLERPREITDDRLNEPKRLMMAELFNK
ncbi:MAG: ABC transporter ATP-binding protein [Thaumarchaeota archaeon]|nr:ABC transporter ATP-binding protein [Nitrososphaerota archaeon]